MHKCFVLDYNLEPGCSDFNSMWATWASADKKDALTGRSTERSHLSEDEEGDKLHICCSVLPFFLLNLLLAGWTRHPQELERTKVKLSKGWRALTVNILHAFCGGGSGWALRRTQLRPVVIKSTFDDQNVPNTNLKSPSIVLEAERFLRILSDQRLKNLFRHSMLL